MIGGPSSYSLRTQEFRLPAPFSPESKHPGQVWVQLPNAGFIRRVVPSTALVEPVRQSGQVRLPPLLILSLLLPRGPAQWGCEQNRSSVEFWVGHRIWVWVCHVSACAVCVSLWVLCVSGGLSRCLCVFWGVMWGGSFYLCVSCLSESLPTVHLFRCGQSSRSYTSDWMQAGVIHRIVVALCDGFQSQKTWVHSLTSSSWL